MSTKDSPNDFVIHLRNRFRRMKHFSPKELLLDIISQLRYVKINSIGMDDDSF